MAKFDVLVRARPSSNARVVGMLRTRTRFTLRRAVAPVIEQGTGRGGSKWLRVALDRRPSGASGWIPRWATRVRRLHWRIAVDLSSRRAKVYRDGRLVHRYRVVVGAPASPTPAGHFFVVDRMRLHNSWARGGWALATSAYSEVLRHFDGGDGQVALHAKGALSAPLGTAASHGCVRFSDRAIAWMAKRIPVGTPIDITH
jgi:lipoprotein-anchoring transpeptidase ErfK/SrfK